MLSKNGFEKAKAYILSNGRYLEKLKFQHAFENTGAEKLVKALQMYQNKDGGYGNALEPDFRLPNSSAMATSVALQLLVSHETVPGAEAQIDQAITYLESTFRADIHGWEDVPKHVNLFPHAPWWHRTEAIDYVSGNPSAELVGYLWRYKDKVKELEQEPLLTFYLERLEAMTAFEVHEIFCYMRLYNALPESLKPKVLKKLKQAYKMLVATDPEAWQAYEPYPLKFEPLDGPSFFAIPEKLIALNLEHFSQQIETKGYIAPTWQWSDYAEEWESARREWSGILTLEALLLLKKFNALDMD